MKGLKIIALGILIWGLSLIWPEANQILTSPVTIGLLVALLLSGLVYTLARHFNRRHDHNSGAAGQDRPSRPIPAILTG